jgi:translation elongation factor EF-1beta
MNSEHLGEVEELNRKWEREDDIKHILEWNKESNSDLNLESILNESQNEIPNKNQDKFQNKSEINSGIKLLEINLYVAREQLEYWFERYQKLSRELSEIKREKK